MMYDTFYTLYKFYSVGGVFFLLLIGLVWFKECFVIGLSCIFFL